MQHDFHFACHDNGVTVAYLLHFLDMICLKKYRGNRAGVCTGDAATEDARKWSDPISITVGCRTFRITTRPSRATSNGENIAANET